MINGFVFSITRFSTSYGPGIRTTVSLKGCPLSCVWCHHPESQSFAPQLILRPKYCVACGVCLENCPNGAITSGTGTINTNLHECTVCGICVDLCTTGARAMVGEKMSAAEVIAEVFKDIAIFEQSNGGVTFSGGEPVAQPDFVLELLKLSKELSIHTTLNTSGFTQWGNLRSTLPYTDLYLYDIKSLDDQIHQRFTHVSNQIILENLDQLIQNGASVILRVVILPGINDRPKDIQLYQRLAKKYPEIQGLELSTNNQHSSDLTIPIYRDIDLYTNQHHSKEIVSNIAEALRDSYHTINIGS